MRLCVSEYAHTHTQARARIYFLSEFCQCDLLGIRDEMPGTQSREKKRKALEKLKEKQM